ncbi:MAG TPA: PQQ-binding-like beta-propeller repeat protein [Solirubrobacteraceae bacterium]|jgi:outer membrane protein assembly factor BamB|nr:PQQ-binding-like beta-propeller repeat protein [Solirubrobacteraceae bacterium]
MAAARPVREAASGGDWLTFGFDNARTGENPSEHQLGPGNVGSLAPLWSADLGGASNTQPLVASGVQTPGGRHDLVLAGSETGLLSAVDSRTGAVVWRRELGHTHTSCPDLPGGVYGVTSTPVIDAAAGVVYVAGGDDRLYALDLGTGATRRGWPVGIGARRRTDHVWGALALSGGLLYAATASYCDKTFYVGRVTAVDTHRPRPVATWYPVTRRHHGGGVWGWGGVAVDGRDGSVYAATANAQVGVPETYGLAEHVVRLSARLRVLAADRPQLPRRQDDDFGATPVLYQAPGCPAQLAVVHKTGALLVYDLGAIASGARQQLQIASDRALSSFGTYAYSRAQNMLVVSNPSDSSGPYRHGLLAFAVGTDCRLALRWQASTGPATGPPSPPIVAGGVVYVATGEAPGIAAFDAATGGELWSSGNLIQKAVYAAPTVAGGRLYAVSWDHRLYAFGLQ